MLDPASSVKSDLWNWSCRLRCSLLQQLSAYHLANGLLSPPSFTFPNDYQIPLPLKFQQSF